MFFYPLVLLNVKQKGLVELKRLWFDGEVSMRMIKTRSRIYTQIFSLSEANDLVFNQVNLLMLSLVGN